MVVYFLLSGSFLELPQPLSHNGSCTKITFISATVDLKSNPTASESPRSESQLHLYSASDDIILCIAFRLHTNLVALNGCIDGKWGHEERIPLDKQFTSGGPNAIITIRAEPEGYLITFDKDRGYFYNRRNQKPVVKIFYAQGNPHIFSNPIIFEPEYTKKNCTCWVSDSKDPDYRYR